MKVKRLVPIDNLKYMPKSGKVIGGYLPKSKQHMNLVRVELDLYWIAKNGKVYNKLMGNV